MDENAILKALSEQTQAALKQAKAEEERRAIEEERLRTEKKRLREEEQKNKVLWAIFERYANLGEQVTGQVQMVGSLVEAINNLFAFSEWFEELSEHIELIQLYQQKSLELQRLIAPRMRNGSREKLEQLLSDIDNGPQIISLKRQLSTLHRRLYKLKEQRALGGTDPKVEIEIENIQEEIAEVEDQLKTLTEE